MNNIMNIVNLRSIKSKKSTDKIWKIFSEEKGKLTVEATIICVYIIVITMTLITSIVNIYNNSLENREKERGRNMTAIEAFNGK